MALEVTDIDRLREIFVTREECNDTTRGIETKITESDKSLIEIKTQLKIVLSVLGAVGLAVLSLVVKQFWGA